MESVKIPQISKIRALVAGDFMLDRYLYSEVSRISPEAPVPVAKIKRMETRIGGAGNVALNVIALGGNVRALSCLGQDGGGEELAKALRAQGVDTAWIYWERGRRTSIKTRVVSQNQQLLRYDEEELAEAGPDFLAFIEKNIRDIFEGVQVVILSDYGKGILTPQTAQLIIQEAKARKLPILVDPKGADYSKYAQATVCTPNQKELAEAGGKSNLESEEAILDVSVRLCRQHRIDYILATRSEKGISLIEGISGEKKDFPAVVQEISDVTGAGDTVISTVGLCMAAGCPLEMCCQIANAAASVVVSKFGAATATVDEIDTVLKTQEGVRREKICTRAQIERYSQQLHKEGKRIVFTNGCFDLVHAGHVSSFWQARKMGDILVVGVNSDGSVQRLKGPTRPVIALKDRVKVLEALEMIDYVVPFEEDTPQTLIEAIRPDVLVKGKDWEGKRVAGADFLASYGGIVVFVDLEQGLSTTAVINRILRANR